MFSLGLGGSKGNSKSTTDTTANVDSSQQQYQNSGQSQKSKGTTNINSVVSSLDQGTQDVLKNLIAGLGAKAGSGADMSALAESLFTRGQNAESALNANVAAIVGDAARTGGQQVGRLQTELASGAGSKLNTYVAGATAEASADLTSKLAALDAQLRTGNRQTATSEMQSALQLLGGAQGADASQIASLASILKGATTNTNAVQQTAEQQSLAAWLKNLTNEQQNATSHSKTKGDSGSSGFGLGIDL